MSDRIPSGETGQNYQGQILGTDDDGYIRKINIDENGHLNIEPVSDYFHKVAMNEIPNHYFVYKFGRNSNVGATEVLISANGYYGMPSVAQAITVTSSSGLDVVGGTGARTIEIIGLNENGVEVSEIINMGATTTNLYKRVFRARVVTSGIQAPIGDSNQGTLTFAQTPSGTIMVQILPNDGQTKTACYTIPKGYVGLMWSADTTTGEGKNALNQLKTRDTTVTNASFNVKGVRDNYQNTVGQQFKVPIPYTELTDIVFTSKSSSAGTSVSASFLIELIKVSE